MIAMNKKTKAKINEIENKLLSEICYNLDAELYLPMKERLAKEGIIHPLGILKEYFKSFMCLKINQAFNDMRETIENAKNRT